MKEAKIFIAMPFDKELGNVFYVVKQYGTRKGYNVWRADENKATVEIFSHILGKISESDVVIADVTYANPNVFLEIGYSWAIGKEVLLIAEHLNDLPFDVRGHTVFAYNDRKNANEIENVLSSHIDAAVTNAFSKSNLTFEVLQIAKKIANADDKEHIYYKILESQISRVSSEIDKWLLGSMDVNRNDLVTKGMEIFDTISEGGFATFFAPLEGYWEENNDYVLKSREVANDPNRPLNIERVYILGSIAAVTSEHLLRNIEADENSNIKTYVAFKDELDKDSVRDFGIWDENIVCIVNLKENSGRGYEVLGGRFSKIKHDLEEYDGYRRDIKKYAIRGTKLLEEIKGLSQSKLSLFHTALTMEELSYAHCEGGYLSSSSCSWYHSAWQYLRLIDMVSTPSWHEGFYKNELDRFLEKNDQIRILISGTADYGMLEQIFSVNDISRIDEVMIIDLCNSPLSICDEYNRRRKKGKLKINKLKQDIRKTVIANETFDLILTDAFLTRFSTEDRIDIVVKWFDLLKPGGMVLTTARVENNKEKVISTKADIIRYKKKVENKIKASGELMHHLHNKILSKAEEYAKNIISYPLKNEDEVRSLFKHYKLSINLHSVKGEIQENTLYAQIKAQKSAIVVGALNRCQN